MNLLWGEQTNTEEWSREEESLLLQVRGGGEETISSCVKDQRERNSRWGEGSFFRLKSKKKKERTLFFEGKDRKKKKTP